jgi:hypothetical protein
LLFFGGKQHILPPDDDDVVLMNFQKEGFIVGQLRLPIFIRKPSGE